MKKTTMGVISVALLALGLAAGIVMIPAKTARADEIPVVRDNFPDDNFRSWVFENFDGTLSEEEINETKEIDVSGMGITDLTGIEYFTEIDSLNCSGNGITELNLTTFHNLNYLYCGRTKLTELNTSKNHLLQEISCVDSQLSSIDVTGSFFLKEIKVYSENLKFLDLSMNTMLEKVNVLSRITDGKIYLPPNVEELNVPTGWKQKILTKDNWSVKETNWILNDAGGYDYADITFQYNPAIENYEVTVRTYAVITKAEYVSCEKSGKYLYEASLIYSESRTGQDITVSKTVEIPATGHDWGDWYVSKQATVDEEGEERRICRHDASHVETKKINKLTPTPTKKPVATITVDKKNAEVVVGKTITLKATVKGSTNAVAWKSSNSNIATVNKNGKITAKQAGKVTITASCGGATAKCSVQVLFKDVTNKNDYWYKPAYYLNNKGVVKGYANQTEFRAGNKCTRAQIVTFLYRFMGEPKTKSSKCPFQDVISSDYYFKPVIWAVENGITTGISETEFGPSRMCTRGQIVTFIWRMAGSPEPQSKYCMFPDVRRGAYYYKAAMWAYEKSILSGYSDGTFRPYGDCLRKQVVTFLYKYDMKINKKG
ncbi:MAG: S-layer homology domain-containing protein [Saccharofermentans sp.]|nr:S-layer homology domain-containing protein [Saccharofermentans sp.]